MPRERRLTEKAAAVLAEKQIKDDKKAKSAESRRVSKAAEGQMGDLTNAFGNIGFGSSAQPADEGMILDGGRKRRRKTGKKVGGRKRKTKKNVFGY